MKYIGTQWWVEYNFENGLAMTVQVFKDEAEAKEFAQEQNSKAKEVKVYKC